MVVPVDRVGRDQRRLDVVDRDRGRAGQGAGRARGGQRQVGVVAGRVPDHAAVEGQGRLARVSQVVGLVDRRDNVPEQQLLRARARLVRRVGAGPARV